MKRSVAFSTALAVTAAFVGVAPPPALAAGTDVVDGFRDGLDAVGVWLGDLGTYADLAEPLPLTDLVPGGPDGLDLQGTFSDAAGGWRTALAPAAADLSSLADALEAVPDADVSVGEFTEDAGVTSATIDIAVERHVTAPLSVVDPSSGAAVSTTAPDGVPVTLRFAFDLTASIDELTGEFWIGGDPGASFDAFVDADADGAPDVYSFAGAGISTIVGVAEVEVLDTSTLAFETHAELSVTDADGNGRLAFEERAADGTLNPSGELTLPKSENVTVAHAVEAATGQLDLGLPAGIEVVGGGAPAIDISLAGDPAAVEVAVNEDFVTGIGAFANIDATELLAGVGQLSNMLEVVQSQPIADVDLPFVDLLLSQMLGTTDDIKQFVVAQTEQDDPATVVNEFGTASFATIQEFLALINADGTGLSITDASFDPATGQLDLPLRLFADDGGFVELEALLFDEVSLDPERLRIGRPALGDALEDALGLTGLAALMDEDGDGQIDTEIVDGETLLKFAPPTTLVDRVRDIDIPWGVDLDPSQPCEDCDLAETLDLEESETLPAYRRFFVRDLASGPEFEVDIAATMDTSDLRGTAGFVDIDAADGSVIELGKADASAPSLALDLTYPAELVEDGAVPVQSFVFHLAYSPEAPTPEMPSDDYDATELLGVADNLAGTATLELSALGLGDAIPILGQDTVGVELSWPDLAPIDEVQLADTEHSVVVTNAAADAVAALAQLNFAPETPGALFATIIDHLEGLGAGLEGVLAAGDLAERIPFLAGTPGDLVDVFSELDAAVQSLRAGAVPDRLRPVLERLEDQLGQVPDLGFEDVGGDGTLDLVVDFAFDRAIDEALSLNSGDLGIPMAGAEVAGEIGLTGSASAELTVPISLAPTTGPLPAADVRIGTGSGLEFDVAGAIDDTEELSASAFGQQLRLGPGGEFHVGFGGSLAYTGSGSGYVSLSEFGANFGGGLTGSADDCASTDDGIADVPGGLACVNLPVFLNDAPLTGVAEADRDGDEHYLQASWADLGVGPDVIHTPEDITGMLSAELLSFLSFGEGLDRFLDLLTDVLRGELFGIQVPLIGDELDGIATVVEDVRAIKDEFASMPALDPNLDAAAALEAAFAPVRTGLGDLLLDLDEDGEDDLVVVGDCGGVVCDDTHDPLDIESVEVAFSIGDAATGDADFDLGLAGLDFAGLDGDVDASADWQVQLGFGVSKAADFYLLDDPKQLLYGGTAHGEELSVGASASIGDEGIAARFGILGFEVTNREGETSEAAVELTGDLQGTGGRISIVDLVTSNPLDTFDPRAEVGVDLNLDLASLEDVGGTPIEGLPRVYADFDVEWGFDTDGTTTTPLSIVLGDPSFDIGAALSEMFGPIFSRIHGVVEVADDVRSFVFAPIPVISDLSRTFGGGDYTFVDLAEIFGDVDLGFLEDVDKVIRFASTISSLGAGDRVSFAELASGAGDFEVVFDPQKALQPKPAPSQAATSGLYSMVQGGVPTTVGSMTAALKQAANDGGASGSDVDDVLDDSGAGETFSMPIVNDPSCILGMLGGGDCTVLDWQPEELYLGAQVEMPFGPFFGVLYINIGGFAGAGVKFGMGFSTRGIRQAIERGDFESDPAAGIGNLIVEGIYIRDFAGPELYVNAGIYAEGELNVVVAAAGVRGGIEASLGFDLIDGPEMDGLVHLDEMATRIHNPLCLFEVVGFLEAFLQIYLEIGPCPFCVEESFELARVRLLDFAARMADCGSEPVLADVDDGTIRLNIGTRASQRGTLGHIEDEQVTVREIRAPADGQPGRFSVSAFGTSQEYEGHDIWFNAGDGNDVLLFQGSKAGPSPAVGETPPAEDTASQTKGAGEVAPFTAKVVGYGGAGNDAITTGDGDDEIWGGDDPADDTDPAESSGDGKDQITAGRGDDTLRGGPDADQLDAGLGRDRVLGEGGNDTINGGPGADHMLDGGPGNDRVNGGSHVVAEDGTVLHADGADAIAGGSGDDHLYGGPDDDTITGDAWDDQLDPDGDGAAGGGVDVIHGEDGDDDLFGGRGGDVILGDGTDEPTEGTTTADTIHGQGDDDVLVGAWGADEIHGGDGSDVLNGSDGDDDLFGDAGEDRIFGDRWGTLGAIELFGGRVTADAVTLPAVDLSFLESDIGAEGRDLVDGGAGDDILAGDGDDDRIRGAAGDDYITGGDGRDLVVGDDVVILGSADDGFAAWETDGTADDAETLPGTFDDVVLGGPGDDEIHGEGGDDLVRGSAGDDLIFGNDGEDELHGDLDDDEAYGGADDDRVEGGPGDDLLLGNEGTDRVFGQAGDDRLIGGSGFRRAEVSADARDLLYGGAGADVILGDNGEVDAALEVVTLVPTAGGAPDGEFGGDLLVGDGGADTLHGQDGDDELHGGNGDDQLFGELGGDELLGQGGHDHLVGDRGRVGLGSDGNVTEDRLAHHADTYWPAETTTDQGAPLWAVELVGANDEGGTDILDGELGDDHLYGGVADDVLRGGWGDDWMEGNAGRDTMFGLSDDPAAFLIGASHDDQDVLLGGSSDVNPEADKHDDGELVMHGNNGQDVLLGDNGNVERLTDDAGTAWQVDPVTGGHARRVELLDRERRDPAELAVVSGHDLMHGDGGADRMFGQGGQDLVKGNDGDDQLHGNQDRDIVEGNAGDDDVIGGSDLVADLPGVPADHGDPDDGDWLYGGADADVITGDNAVITREPAAGTHYYETALIGVTAQRGVDLLDVAQVTADNAGPDQISGGAGVDALFGQDDRDHVTGNGDDDYMEGNGAGDFLWGDLALDDADGYDPPEVFGADLPAVTIAPIDHPLVGDLSDAADLFGPAAADGQDDQIGGWSQPGMRDDGDMVLGDGAQDFQLGDNGTLTRTVIAGDPDTYAGYEDYRPDTHRRDVERFDVGDDDDSGTSLDDPTSGDDWLQGDDEDDYQWGQDGADALFGDDLLDPSDVGNDDLIGELDGDTMFGGPGEDAMLGDRGTIVNTKVDGSTAVEADTQGPMFLHYEGLLADQLDRRVDLLHDEQGEPLSHDGISSGGRDFMRGGPAHDSMHGGAADDWMNGDSGADWLFGDHGDDAMWGGRGSDDPDAPLDDADADDALFNSHIDLLFGGYGEDVLDFKPRDEGVPGHDDEPVWRTITGLDNADPDDDQHHQGVDWIYGGWDRDVLQGNIGQNGPDFGDRLIDWNGAYNLFTRCNASYGDDGDVRQRSPMIEDAIWTMAFGSGIGASVEDVTTSGSSAFEELGFVHKRDNRHNSGRAHPGTPGHFFTDAC